MFTLSEIQDGQGRHAPENVEQDKRHQGRGQGKSRWEPESKPSSPNIQPMVHAFSLVAERHPHPKQQNYNTACVGSHLGWVTDLPFAAQFKHHDGVRGTSLPSHFSWWVSSGICRPGVVSQSCPGAKSQQKRNPLKWKAEFCRKPKM